MNPNQVLHLTDDVLSVMSVTPRHARASRQRNSTTRTGHRSNPDLLARIPTRHLLQMLYICLRYNHVIVRSSREVIA